MKAPIIPTVAWLPGNRSATLLSADRTWKCDTIKVLHALLTGEDPNDTCMRLKLKTTEYLVAIAYEIIQRKRMFHPQVIPYIDDLKVWAELSVQQMKHCEPISWPPPSVKDFKERNNDLD